MVRDADYKTLKSELWRYGRQNHTCHISWVNGTIGLRVVVRGALGRDEVSSYRWPLAPGPLMIGLPVRINLNYLIERSLPLAVALASAHLGSEAFHASLSAINVKVCSL